MTSASLSLASLRRAVLAVALLAPTLPAEARDSDTRTPAGYVVAASIPSDDPDAAAHILREGQEISVQIGGPLFDGDQVVVRDAGAAVTIETVNDRQMRVDAAHSPHPISGALPSGGRFSALAAMIGELFQGKPAARTVNLIGRTDDALKLPFGRAVPQRVEPGTRLWLGWQGGAGPYTVEIRDPAKRGTVIAAAPAAGRTAVVPLPREASGALVLAVRDTQGTEVLMDLRVDPGPPPVPAWISEGAPTPAFARVAAALWLLDRKPAEWDLQAAALAAGSDDYAAAGELLRRLAEGQRPTL